MSEVLVEVKREEIIDFEKWIELRSVKNELEYDYPDELEKIVKKVFEFIKDR